MTLYQTVKDGAYVLWTVGDRLRAAYAAVTTRERRDKDLRDTRNLVVVFCVACATFLVSDYRSFVRSLPSSSLQPTPVT